MTKSPHQDPSFFNLEKTEFRHEPFPVGRVANVFDPGVYEEMLANWPATEQFKYMPNLGHKYSLSEVNKTKKFYDAIKTTPIWKRFFDEVKSEKFVIGLLDFLIERHVDLGLRQNCIVTNKASLYIWRRLQETFRVATLLGSRISPLRSWFEFSMLPGDQGCVKPHTDAPTKYITLVIAMDKPGEWKESYGGGTAITWPKDSTHIYNHKNAYLEFDQVEKLETYEFEPNQCLIFVKTFNSWHAVEPLQTSDPKMFKKSLTINFEAPRGWH